MNLRKLFLSITNIVVSITAILPVNAAQPVSEAFKTAPSSLLPLLAKNTRLDMLDYFNSGMDTPSKNELNGNSRIESMTDETILLTVSPASKAQLATLPYGNGSLVVFISTIETPAPDSKMNVYTFDWSQELTAKVFKEPELKDWLTDEGKKKDSDIEAMMPFMLVAYNYDPSTKILALTNNSASFISEDVYKIISPYLHKQLTYHWNGKKFEPVK